MSMILRWIGKGMALSSKERKCPDQEGRGLAEAGGPSAQTVTFGRDIFKIKSCGAEIVVSEAADPKPCRVRDMY